MTIETKYNIGDEVWCLDFFGDPQKGEITHWQPMVLPKKEKE